MRPRNCLNLDPEFVPYVGSAVRSAPSVPFKAFTFHGGEPHVKLQRAGAPEVVEVTHRIRSWNDLGLLAVAVDALRRHGCKRVSATLPYFPGARQDRVAVPGEALTVKVYADFVNSLGFERVTIFDPHSDVTPALIDNVRVVSGLAFGDWVSCRMSSKCVLVSPDAGASKKTEALSRYGLSDDPAARGRRVVHCSKLRDVRTGALSGFEVHADDLEGVDALIVDDICDGGGTFLGLADELKAKGAGDLFLAVSHGIFSKGVSELLTKFRGVYTTDAFRSMNDIPGFRQIPLADLAPFNPYPAT